MRAQEMLASRCARALCTAGVLLATGCATGGAAFESVTTLPKPARYPAGADVNPSTTLPPPERRASTAAGLVVLTTPQDPEGARAIVAAFFHAVVEESPRALASLFTRDAAMQNGSRREVAQSIWAARFTRFDYRGLAGETLYRDADLKLSEEGDAVVVKARIDVAWGARPRMFGDELTFRMIPNGSSWLIAEVVEDFRTP